jgi:ACS family tartrate transporter-like MFS transporter
LHDKEETGVDAKVQALSLGNFGGWFGPSIYGLIRDATGGANVGLLFRAAGPLLTAICALLVGQGRRLERISTRR